MDEANRRALLREVLRSQATCRILRTGIMMGARYCTYPRWVPYTCSDGSITWRHERLKLGKSLTTAFARELGVDTGHTCFWRRFHATHLVRSVDAVETAAYDDASSFEALQIASFRLADILPALQIVFVHAQEYGVCWAWTKTADGPAGTQKMVGSPLDKALRERSVGRASDEQFALREQAASWLQRASISYVGDERQPADLPPPKK